MNSRRFVILAALLVLGAGACLPAHAAPLVPSSS